MVAGVLPTTLDEAKALVRRLFGTAKGRRQIVRRPGHVGLGWYAYWYLGLATPRCHLRWYDAFASERRLLFLAPRSHGKSISAGRVLVGHTIVTNRNARILLVGKTKGAAAKTARLVRRDLEKNQRIIRDWTGPATGGPFREKGLSWTDSFFYVRRTLDARDPTVEAVGAGGSITGGRFDLIILDDPIDDENTRTEARRRRIRDWFYGTVLPLLDVGGRVVVIGTRKHASDLYATLENDPTFAMVADQAFVDGLDSIDLSRVQWVEELDGKTGRRKLVDAVVEGEPPKVLWPEKWSVSALLLMLKSMGSVLFARELQNRVVDDGSSPFKLAWLDAAKARGKGRGFVSWGVDPATGAIHPRCAGLILWQSWDLSLVDDIEKAEQANSDYSVGYTFGLDWETGDRYLLRAVRHRGLTQGQLLALIRAEAALFVGRLVAVVVESNAFGRLHEAGLRRSTDLPIYGHLTTSRKSDPYEGVPGMSAVFENAHMVFPYGRPDELGEGEIDARGTVDVIAGELHGLGREAKDDCVMALYVSETWIRRWIAAEEKRRARGGSRVTGG